MKKCVGILLMIILVFGLLCGCKVSAPPKIAFVYSEVDIPEDIWEDVEYDFEIYVIDTDGTNMTKLTINYPDDWYVLISRLAWSPDGHTIAYVSYDDGVEGISVVDIDSGNQAMLTSGLSFYYTPSWSPDGRKIAFSAPHGGRNGVYVMDADGSNLTDIIDIWAGGDCPVWSPDGSRIAFFSSPDGDNEFWVMDADGSNPTSLIGGFGIPDWGEVLPIPAWSPNGSKIAINSEEYNEEYDYRGEIYVVDADGSNLTNLTNAPEYYDAFPVWSPDGSKIAYVSWRDDTAIYIMDADGSNPTRLTEIVSSDYDYPYPWFVPQHDWSPDGSQIAFVSGGAIYVIDADGSNLTRLTDREGVYILPAWSP